MPQTNQLFKAPPYAVEEILKTFGRNLKTARLRRGLTIEQAAQKIGTGVRAISEVENGKTSTAVSVYAALLWAYDLIGDMKDIASPLKDAEGLRLASLKEPQRARKIKSELNNDF
jgi:transcriptional regulator with XRE-family HTH domain